jgi:hypothetical protein
VSGRRQPRAICPCWSAASRIRARLARRRRRRGSRRINEYGSWNLAPVKPDRDVDHDEADDDRANWKALFTSYVHRHPNEGGDAVCASARIQPSTTSQPNRCLAVSGAVNTQPAVIAQPIMRKTEIGQDAPPACATRKVAIIGVNPPMMLAS